MLENFLSQTREQVSQNIKKSIGNSNLIEEAMSYSALGDSKMIRAALINASGRINKNMSDSSLLTFSTGVELIHTYSLIHDDLPSMDDDDLRRGKDSSHIKFGEANAILAGDALQSLAYEIICNESSLIASPNGYFCFLRSASMICRAADSIILKPLKAKGNSSLSMPISSAAIGMVL